MTVRESDPAVSAWMFERFRIDDLAENIYRGVENPPSDFRLSAVEERLKKPDINLPARGMNGALDRIPPEQAKGGFDTKTSISFFEASRFLSFVDGGKCDDFDKAIGEGLKKIFGIGGARDPLSPVKGRITKIESGDTYTVEFTAPEGTVQNAGRKATVSVRASGVDAPEAGDGPILSNNRTRVYIELVSKFNLDPLRIDMKEAQAIDRIIKEEIFYTGKLSRIAAEGYFLGDSPDGQNGEALILGAQDLFDEETCLEYRRFDRLGRPLGIFTAVAPGSLENYIRDGLPGVMAEKGRKIYEDFKEKIEPDLALLGNSKYHNLAVMAGQIKAGLIDPAVVFGQEECNRMADTFAKQTREAKTDVQIMQIITGTVHPDFVYRNQRWRLYSADKRFGFWSDVIFSTLWDANEKIIGRAACDLR